jgi:hypothetical protein
MLFGKIIPGYSEKYTCMLREIIAGFSDNYK